jgi:hypothetical protein
VGSCEVDASGSGYGPVAGSFEYGNVHVTCLLTYTYHLDAGPNFVCPTHLLWITSKVYLHVRSNLIASGYRLENVRDFTFTSWRDA